MVILVFQTIIIVQSIFTYSLIIVQMTYISEVIQIPHIMLVHLQDTFSTVMEFIKLLDNFINKNA